MEISDFSCMVGGLPRRRSWPFAYKAPFSPIDVIEEYLRPARLVENGIIVTRPALSEPELVDLDPVGTLEAFNTDGLRSLLRTMNIKNMKEKTLRYPGHIEIMKIFRETGFFSSEPVLVNGAMVAPIDVTAKLLLPKWHLKEDEEEFTIMRIYITGTEKGRTRSLEYTLFDTYHAATHTSSMARTTGYSATAAVQLMLDGDFKRPGICPPEYIGAEAGCTEKILAYLEAREINYKLTEK
jgi:saccharopine dehydrogenase-like NADP-dependent oxidoreductase